MTNTRLDAKDVTMLTRAADYVLKVQSRYLEYGDWINGEVDPLVDDLLEIRMKLLKVIRDYEGPVVE